MRKNETDVHGESAFLVNGIFSGAKVSEERRNLGGKQGAYLAEKTSCEASSQLLLEEVC